MLFVLLFLGAFSRSTALQTKVYFYATESVESYQIPVNVTKLDATVCGANGGGGSNSGGYGQCVTVTQIPVTPGQVIYICVGSYGGTKGGFNGGGTGSGTGYGGGGASDLRTNATNLHSRFLIAAGGGGAGTYNGGNGNTSSGSGSGYGGLATLSTGGAGGKYYEYPNGNNGAYGVGGAAVSNGGGGGGGYYGGGGATYTGGGGGGSSYFSLGTKTSTASNYYATNGSIVLTPYVQYTFTFNYKNSQGTIYPPSDVTYINAVLTGAQGGNTSNGQGGYGGYISATVTDSKYLYRGVTVYAALLGSASGGGAPITNAYCREGGLGGGYSSLSYYASNKYTTVLVAGGGGGAGFDPTCKSSCNASSINGGSGGTTGTQGLKSPVMASSYGGKGATVSVGGVGGFYNSSYKSGYTGYSYYGGSPAGDTCGGGGGGGYYGGGGGANTGGGGGSNYYYTTTLSNVVQKSGVNQGDGVVTVTYWSAMNTQPTFLPTLSPYSGSSTDSNDSSSNSGATASAIIIPLIVIGICCCCGYFYKKNQHQSYITSTSTAMVTTSNPVYGTTKITSAVNTINEFLTAMMSSDDRCSVVSFSNTYVIRENLSSCSRATSAITACRWSVGGGTNLYDAGLYSVVQFIETADKRRPWLLIILTDGEDTGSTVKPSQLIDVLKAFNQSSTNFVFVIGLGRSLQDNELRRICSASGSAYLRANDIEAMKVMFALIALRVVQQSQVEVAAIQAEGIEAVFARVRTARAVAKLPIDIIVLLDTSGSMNESA